LSGSGFAEQTAISCKQDAAQGTCAVQQFRIGEAGGAVVLRGEDVNPAEAQFSGDGTRDVDVHIEPEAHAGLRDARRRLRKGESSAAAARASLS
jgi:hypothetical protein